MKKLLLSFVTCMLILPLAANNLDKLTGSYTGNLDVSLWPEDGEELPMPQTQNVKVYTEKKEGENTLTFLLKDFTTLGMEIGDIEVPNVSVDENGKISAPEIVLDKNSVGLGMLLTTLNGTLTPEGADLDINVIWNGNINIKVKYIGTKDITDSMDQLNANALSTVIANNRLSVLNATIQSYVTYNINGTLIDRTDNAVESINLSQYAAGIYIIEIQTNAGKITRKISCK